MCISARFAPAALALLTTVSFSSWARAIDLNGAWAQDSSVCSKVFVKGGNKILFAPNAELYGAGVLIEGKQATGSFQKCQVKSIRADGNILHLVAACSTGVMVSDTQVTVKIVDDDNITLTLAGPDQMESPLVRCSL
jgi:hypothetical protein